MAGRRKGGVAHSSEPASFGAKQGSTLAVWQTGLAGLTWLDELVKKGHAIDLGGNGYPSEYSAKASHIIPRLLDRPPLAKSVWTRDAGDIITPKWLGKTTTYSETIDACRYDEWLIVQAWDES